MAKQPLVTIIMSSYNHSHYVKEAIESAVHQSYQNIEFLVIDDGSTDNSVEVIEKLQQQYSFHFESRTNHGLVKTLNYALKHLARGKYICVLDSDDYWALDKIAQQVSLIEKHPDVGLCYSPIYYIDAQSNITSDYNHPNNTKSGHIFEEYFRGDLHIPDGGVMIPKAIFEAIGYYDEDVELEDYQLWFKILEKYPAIYLDKYLCYYRVHDTNVSNDERKMLAWEEQVIEKWKGHPVYERSISKIMTRWFSKYAKYDKKKAFNLLFGLLKYPKVLADKNFYKGIKRLLFYW